jgi:hypothetical protein
MNRLASVDRSDEPKIVKVLVKDEVTLEDGKSVKDLIGMFNKNKNP